MQQVKFGMKLIKKSRRIFEQKEENKEAVSI